MGEKKIIVNINENGDINAETFGMAGLECIDALDKLMKDLALRGSRKKKPGFYEQKITGNNTITNKND